MKRVLLALAALLLWLPAFADAAPLRHAVAAKARVCRAGSVRLADGLCCPRSGVTRGGGCVSGAIRPDIVPPPLAYCPNGRLRDALGRCPAPACTHGYSRDRFGQCRLVQTLCANGRTRDASGQCPSVSAAPRVGIGKVCLGGQPPLASGLCPALFLCSNGYAPVAGRCGRGVQTAARPALAPRLAPLASQKLATPRFHTAPALARPHLVAPRLQSSSPLASPHVFRPAAPHLAAPHLAPAPVFHPAAPPAFAAPHLAPLAPAPHLAPAPVAAPHLL